MPTYGLTPTGFVKKPLSAILADMQASQIAALGADWDVSAESPQGMLNASMATAVAELWELTAAAYTARDPNGASAAQLDALAQITGTMRQVATKGTVTLRVTLNAGATLPAGSIANVAGQPSNQWATLADAVNSSGSAADVTVAAQAVTAGAFVAAAGTITGIFTPQVGWTAVTNDAAAVTGKVADTDASLRVRRVTELAKGGACTQAAIAADLLRANGHLVSAAVFMNDTDNSITAAGQTLPPHSVMMVLYDGTVSPTLPVVSDASMASLVWAQKPTGIQTTGPNNASVTDSNGQPQTVYFGRPSGVAVYISATIKEGANYGSGTIGAIQTALVNYFANFTPGQSVFYALLFGVISFDTTQVSNITALTIGTAPSPTGTTNLPMTVLQIATLTAANIIVTAAP